MPDAQEMAFNATRNMPFIHSTCNKKSWVCFVAVILKVLLVNLLAALNFAKVFLKIKKTFGIKNVKT